MNPTDLPAGIEKAVAFTDLDRLRAWTEPCERVYFGHEFCQRLLPSKKEVAGAVRHVSDQGRAFTLLTPYVSNAGLALVRDLVAEVLSLPDVRQFEVVVNDWGVLHWMRREHPGVPMALGRLLTKQKRGPQILRVADRLPSQAVDHFRRSNVDAPHLSARLREWGVHRVELDNLLQGIRRDQGLPASLYHPFVYVTTTRLCLMAESTRPHKNIRSMGPCALECRRFEATLTHPDMPVPLLLKGNTQFVRNGTLPGNLQDLGITRLVHQPDLP